LPDYSVFRHEVAHAGYYELKRQRSDFEKTWNKIQGKNIYGKNTVPGYNKNCHSSTCWDDGGGGSQPNFGFASPYGSINILEDIATYVEEIVDPVYSDDFISYMNPQSPNYDKRYGLKFYLLKKHGFINSDEWAQLKVDLNLEDTSFYETELENL